MKPKKMNKKMPALPVQKPLLDFQADMRPRKILNPKTNCLGDLCFLSDHLLGHSESFSYFLGCW